MKAANQLCAGTTKDDVPFLKQMLNSHSADIRMYATAALMKLPSDATADVVMELTKNPHKDVRRVAYAYLYLSSNKQKNHILIAGLRDESSEVVAAAAEGLSHTKAQEALPELIGYFQRSKSADGFPEAGGSVGRAIAEISGHNFNFMHGGLNCGTSLMAADEEIEEGRNLGGEKGQELIKRGESGVAYWKKVAEKHDAEALVNNVRERDKVLRWWEARGRK